MIVKTDESFAALQHTLQVGADAGFLHGVGHLGPELPHRALVGDAAPDVDHLGELLRQAAVADHLHPRARRRQEGLDAVHVIRVEVGEDDADDRLVGDPPELLEHLPGGLGPLHRVDDDDAVLSFDHDAVGQTEIDRNVNIVQNFQYLLFIIFWFLWFSSIFLSLDLVKVDSWY